MKRFIFLIAFLLLAGCTSLPPSSSLSFSEIELGKPDQDKAVLVVYRTYLPPTMYKSKIHIDGEHMVSLPNKSFTWMYLDPGEHQVKANWPAVSMILGKKIPLNVEAGNYYYLKLEGNMQPVYGTAHSYSVNKSGSIDTETARREVDVCCKYVPVGSK